MKMLQPRLATLDPWKARGLKMVTYPRTPTQRVSKADNGRTLPLTSAAWRKLRRSVLAEEPLCRHCAAQGLTVLATDVDHMHGADDNRRESLQPLCKSHHSIKTMAEYHGREMRLGCDMQGNPANPAHHWNQAAVGPSGASGEGVTASQEIASD